MTREGSQKSGGVDASLVVHVVGALALVGVTVGVYMGVVAPAYRTRAEEAARVQQATQDAQDLRVLEDNTQALERLTHTLQSRLADTVELRPLDQLNHQVASISGLFEGHNLHVSKMDPGDVVASAQYSFVPIRVAGQGSFTDLVGFLHALHEEHKDVEVSAFLVRADAKSGSDLVLFDVSLGWFGVPSGGGGGAARAGGASSAAGAVAGAAENR